MGLQQYQNQERRPMESSLYHKLGPCQTDCNVLQLNKLASNLSNDNECNICPWDHSRMAHHIYGQHGHPYSTIPRWRYLATHTQTLSLGITSSPKTNRLQSISQTREMYLWTDHNRLPRHTNQRSKDTYERRKGGESPWLNHPKGGHRY